MSITVQCIPAFNDNYFFLLKCAATGQRAVVDPGAARPITQALGDDPLNQILLTHHHADHTGGVQDLTNKYQCTVAGSAEDAYRLPPLTHTLAAGDSIQVGHSTATVLAVPGHTLGHIAYYFAKEGLLFCGDTLFAGGCGRLFEGTPKMMFNSLQQFKTLPANTKIYCAHEYTLANYQFAQAIFPNDLAIKNRLTTVQQKRQQDIPTIPTVLAEELRSNVFLRASTMAEFADLRQKKDVF